MDEKRILAVTHREWGLVNFSDVKQLCLSETPAGEYELQRVNNPFGRDGAWLVLKGTKIGNTEHWWRGWSDPEYGPYQITITEVGD